MNTALQAAELWRRRKSRAEHPDGSFDKAGRWYPSHTESQDCCRYIRRPSRIFPYSFITHCRSKEHIANLLGVSVRTINMVLFLQKKDLAEETILTAIDCAERCGVITSNARALTMAKKYLAQKQVA